MWGVAAANGVYSCGSEMAQVEGFSNAWMWVNGDFQTAAERVVARALAEGRGGVGHGGQGRRCGDGT